MKMLSSFEKKKKELTFDDQEGSGPGSIPQSIVDRTLVRSHVFLLNATECQIGDIVLERQHLEMWKWGKVNI